MSVRVMSWVWESSRADGPALLVLLAIADQARDDGDQAWPAVAKLAAKARVSERTVQRALRSLVELGELEVRPSAGRHGVNVYRVVMTDSHPVTSSPRQTVTPSPEAEGVTPVTRGGDTGDTRTILEPPLRATTQTKTHPRAKRIPDDWTPSPTLIDAMRAEGIADELARRELPRFRDYWAAKPGRDGTKLDWDATWRNWLRRAGDGTARASPNGAATTKAAGWLALGNPPQHALTGDIA